MTGGCQVCKIRTVVDTSSEAAQKSNVELCNTQFVWRDIEKAGGGFGKSHCSVFQRWI